MTPDDMLALAEQNLHMAEWCKKQAKESEGLPAIACIDAGLRYAESCRYWREKARENAE